MFFGDATVNGRETYLRALAVVPDKPLFRRTELRRLLVIGSIVGSNEGALEINHDHRTEHGECHARTPNRRLALGRESDVAGSFRVGGAKNF